MRTITARRPGGCPECGKPIEPGMVLAQIPYGSARRSPSWAHEGCAQQYARNLAASDFDEMVYNY